jgi:hypothetical protein
MPSPRNSVAVVLMLALGPALAGCADYMNHRDSVTLAAGNAPETNLAVHTINPFPPAAWNTTIIADGHPVANAQDAYNAGEVSTKTPRYNNAVSISTTTVSTGGGN